MNGFKIIAIAAFAALSIPAAAQMTNSAMQNTMGSGSGPNTGMQQTSKTMTTHTMSHRMTHSNMKMSMKSCHRMGHAKMMKNKQCRLMMRRHNEMMHHSK